MNRREVERKVYGVHACRALCTRRPEEVVRAYITDERMPDVGDLLHQLAALRRPYKIVAPAELEAITESKHHEGICVVAHLRPPRPFEEALRAPGHAVVLVLVGVENPHNIGAILRTAAHFGVRGAVLAGERERIPASAARTAQGGAEWVDLLDAPDPARAFRAARSAGFAICATTSHGGRDLFTGVLPSRMLLLVGAEDVGLAPELLAEADLTLAVPGTGYVESLNVGSATAVVLAEHWRQLAPADAAPAPKPARPRPGGRGRRPTS